VAFYQNAPDPPISPELRVQCEKAMHVIDEAGRVYRGADAFIFLRRAFRQRLSGVMGVPPFKWLVVFAYWLVSNNRPFFAKFLYRKEKWAG
jgi:predicted DCC family thiol-disulfide oxidoreductase YuxK